MPDIKLDFSRVTYSSLLEVIAPIIPGGILGVGTLILNPQLAARVLSNPYLGYKSRIAGAFFISYVAGLLLNLLVGYNSYVVGYLCGYFFVKNSPTPWRNLFWRRIARRFLGPELAPGTDDLYFEDLHKKAAAEAEQIQDPQAREAQKQFVDGFFGPKQAAEMDWQWWYWALGKYFTKPELWAAPWQYFLSTVHCSSWAVVFLMVLNHRHHWFAWLACLNGIFFGNGVAWFSGGIYTDPYAIAQTASLLHAVRPRSETHTEPE